MRYRIPLLLLIFYCFALTHTKAQGSSSFCNNTALIPVFKQDFGQGTSANSTTSAPVGSTNYNFGGVGSDGNYIVTPRVENANKSDWTRGGDHTGDLNGNMFLVNAGGNRSIFLQQNVSDLCPGSSYSFTAWLANVNTPTTQGVCGAGLVYPKITFNIKDISDNLLATYTTDILPLSPVNGPVNWIKYGFQFSLPTNITSLKLEIVDFHGGGAACGNDVALDDILFEACVPQITVSLNGNSDVCVGDSGKLQTTLLNSPYTNPAYLWQKSKDGGTTWDDLTASPNDSSNYSFIQVTPANAGMYRVLVAPTAENIFNQYCSAISNTVNFNVNTLPQLQPFTNAPVCTGNNLQLRANASGGSGSYAKYKWVGSNGFVSQSSDTTLLQVGKRDTGTYSIQVTDTKGCKNTASLFVAIDSTPVLHTVSVTDTVCSGNIASTSVLSSVGASAYHWSVGVLNGSISGIGTITNPEYTGTKSASIINTGNIPARIKYSVYAKNNNCPSITLDTVITIMPVTSTAQAGKDSTVCSNTNITLRGNIPTVGTGKWRQIAGPSVASFNNTELPQTNIANLIPGVYSFEWRITGLCGTNADTVNVLFVEKPTPSFTLSDTLICANTPVSITNTTQNIGYYNYQWNFGNNTYSTNANPNAITYLGSSSGKDTSYIITLKAFSNCDTISIIKTITVRSKPIASFTATPLNTCLPLRVTFKVSSTGSGTTNRFLFGNGVDSLLLNDSSFIHSYFGNSNSILQPQLVVTNSCGTDTAVEFINAIANNLVVNNNLNDTTACGTPFIVRFENNTMGANAQIWNWGDGQTSTNPGTTPTHTYQNPGVYTVTHTIQHICGDTTISKTIRINKIPTVSISQIPGSNCIGDTIRLHATYDSTIQYKWILNNQVFDSVAQTKYIFKTPGNHSPLLYTQLTDKGFTCTDSSNIAVNIVAEKPGKASINPTNGSCVPFTINLFSESLPAVKVTWNMGNDTVITGDSTQFTYTTGGDYWVKMNALNMGGCTFVDSALISIRSPQGKVDFRSGAYCNNNFVVSFNPTVQFTDRIVWDFGDGISLETSVHAITHTYSKPGIYHPRVTLISHTGCRITLPITDSVVIENVKANFNTKTIYECGQTVFQFSDTSHSSHGIAKFIWRTDGQTISTNTIANSTFNLTGTHTTQLVVQGKYGCRDTVSGSYNVNIYSLPKVNINSINEACLNSLMEFKSEISSIDSVIFRLWNLGNGKNFSDSSVRILFYDQGQYSVRLTVATVNQCYDSALKQITIHPVPEVKVAGPDRICIGETVELQAAGAKNFIWKDQQDSIVCNNCLTLKVKPLRNTEYRVIGYNEFGCTQIRGATVKVIDKPKIQVSPEDTICQGESVRLWVRGANSYEWLPAAGLNSNTSSTPMVSPTTTTSYRVVGRDMNNCFADTAIVRVVVGNPTPLVVGRDSTFVAGSRIQLRANTNGNNIVRWKWTGGSDLSCVNCPNPIARVVFDECISCAATNIYGCTSNDTVCFKTVCPTTEVFLPNAFTPDGDGINDVFFVQAKGVRIIKSLSIYNRWGEQVFQKTNILPNDASQGWNGRIRGNMANPDVYVYLCEVVCEKGGTQLYKGNVAIIK